MSNSAGPVIIVDDDEAVLHSLKFALEIEGLDVRAYDSGRKLLAEASLPPDGCLVIDYAMAGMDGFELIERLRRRNVRLPAIMITGKSSDAIRRRADRAGFRGLFEKPLEDGSLLKGILSVLSSPGPDSSCEISTGCPPGLERGS